MITRAAASRAARCVTIFPLAIAVGPFDTPASLLASADSVAGTAAAARYAEGAPPGFSGGFGQQSCHACHFHADLNAEPGRVTISGVPARFVGGERYSLTVTLTRPGMALGGFQLTARAKEGGAQAGTLAPAAGDEERLAIDVQDAIQYATQRRKGAAPVAPDTSRWALDWTAPQTSGAVVFHVAANAADGDERVDGDYIHTAVAETAPSVAGAVEGGAHGRDRTLAEHDAVRFVSERFTLVPRARRPRPSSRWRQMPGARRPRSSTEVSVVGSWILPLQATPATVENRPRGSLSGAPISAQGEKEM